MQSTNLNGDDKRTVSDRALKDDWYLKVYEIKGGRRTDRFGRLANLTPSPKHFGLALLVGSVFGFGIAAISIQRQITSSSSILGRVTSSDAPRTSGAVLPADSRVAASETAKVQRTRTAAPTSKVTSPNSAVPTVNGVSPSELERIKARNRRLEALIEILRQRQHTPEKKGTLLSAILGE